MSQAPSFNGTPYRAPMPLAQHSIYHDIGEHVLRTRGSGFSTILALRLIASAIANPGTVYRIEDHYKGEQPCSPGNHVSPDERRSRLADVMLAGMVQEIVNNLGLGGITVSRSKLTITASARGAVEKVEAYTERNGGIRRAR